MRQLILVVVTITCALVTTSGQTLLQDAKTEQEVEAFERELSDTLARRDRAGLERLIADGFTFIHASGALDTRKEYIDMAAEGRLPRQRGETERINEPLRIYGGHTAIRTSRATIFDTRLRNRAVYVKVEGRWQWASGQSTGLPVRPKAAAIDSRLKGAYVGQYEINASRSLTVTKEGETLMGLVTGRPKFELIPKSDTEFIRFNEEGGYGDEIVFIRDAEGRVTHAALRGGGQEVWRAKKVK